MPGKEKILKALLGTLFIGILVLLLKAFSGNLMDRERKIDIPAMNVDTSEQNSRFPKLDEVIDAMIIAPDTAAANKYYYFDLKNADQKNKIKDILDILNKNSGNITEDTEIPEKYNGNPGYIYLNILFKDSKSIKIMYTKTSKANGRIKILEDETKGLGMSDKVVISELQCPELIQFLDSGWQAYSKSMKLIIR